MSYDIDADKMLEVLRIGREKLKGKGVAGRKGAVPGDQYVKLKIMLPESQDQEFKDFVERWSARHPYDPRRKAGL